MSDTITIDQVFDQYLPKVKQILDQQLPRSFDNDTLKRYAGNARYAYDVETATKSVLNPIWDMLDRGGKRWRPVLVLLVAETLGGKEDLVAPCAYLCEMVHNGTLAVDDIEDDSKLRRGKPCMHLIFGVDVAINAGNAMYFLPTVIFKELRLKGVDPVKVCQAHELYEQELSNLHFGQGFDIWWHHGHKDPVVDEYLQMCAYKTGTLARLSAKLAALMSDATEEQIEAIGLFAEAIGVGFQIQDDLLNIAGDKFAAKIAVQGEDIHEGKRTLMVIHSFKHAAPEKAERLRTILNEHTNDQVKIQEAIGIMRDTGSLEYAAGVAKDIVNKAWKEIESKFPDNDGRKKLKAFASYLVDRDW